MKKMLPVMCCCHPENQLGFAPESSFYEKREWVDEETGEEGVAFESKGRDWGYVPGFVSDQKITARTWKEKKPKKKRPKKKRPKKKPGRKK